MKILAFDTSTKFLSIACLKGNEVKASFHKDVGMNHSELLMPEIGKLIKSIEWEIGEIELVCIGLGPGSFTGLRIAAGAAKGLAAVLNCKIAGVPTMDAIVSNVTEKDGLVSPFLDARKDKVYACIYRVSKGSITRLSDYLLVEAQSFLGGLKEEVLFFGDGINKYKGKLDLCRLARYDETIDWYPKGIDVGRKGFETGKFIKAEDLKPLYLHPKECNVTKKV